MSLARDCRSLSTWVPTELRCAVKASRASAVRWSWAVVGVVVVVVGWSAIAGVCGLWEWGSDLVGAVLLCRMGKNSGSK